MIKKLIHLLFILIFLPVLITIIVLFSIFYIPNSMLLLWSESSKLKRKLTEEEKDKILLDYLNDLYPSKEESLFYCIGTFINDLGFRKLYSKIYNYFHDIEREREKILKNYRKDLEIEKKRKISVERDRLQSEKNEKIEVYNRYLIAHKTKLFSDLIDSCGQDKNKTKLVEYSDCFYMKYNMPESIRILDDNNKDIEIILEYDEDKNIVKLNNVTTGGNKVFYYIKLIDIHDVRVIFHYKNKKDRDFILNQLKIIKLW